MSSTHRGAKRAAADLYSTPIESFDVLQPYLPNGDGVKFWEPACGDGRLVRRLREWGRKAGGADITPPAGFRTADFLQDNTRRDFIITNPPFSLALPFCEHALDRGREVMLLLRLNFLGSQKRREWWRVNEPSAVFVLSDRPDFTGGGGDSCEYAWFYWGRRWTGIRHL